MTNMSTEQPIDPGLIEQTKQQIRALYAEIAQLARSDISPEEFYAEMLPRVISALAAVGGVVWAKQPQGQLALQYQINLQESRLGEKSEEEQVRHGRLLQKVMSTGEGLLVPPRSGAGDSDQAANPTDWLLVLGPLKTELEVVGVVEIFQRSEAGPAIQRGYLRFLLEVCALASEFLNSRQLRHFSDRQSLWTQLEEFTRLVHASLNPRETAYTIANEGRRLIECDRVSVAIRKGDRCYIEAVSGQDMVDKRSNTVRLLSRLATVVAASEEPMWYSGDTTDMAPQIEEAVQEYVDESHTKMIAVLPLKRPVLIEKEKERPDEPDDAPKPIAALIVEQIEDSRISQKMLSRVDVVAQHSAAALANALEHENVFLMPLWRALGKSRVIVEARNLPKTVLAAVAVVALVVAMAVVPADFRLHAKGTLEPVLRRDVFAGIDGDRVTEVLVEHGDVVKRDQVLARMVNYKLSEEITTVRGNVATTTDQMERLQRQLTLTRQLAPEEQTRLAGEIMEKRAALEALRSSLRIYQSMEKELEVRSPDDGVVITWDVRNRLYMRPVQRGQVLMRIAQPDGPWQLELQMSEDRMGHITAAQNALRAQVRQRLREALRRDEGFRNAVRDKLRRESAASASSNAEASDDASFESRLEQEIEATIAQTPANQWAKKLREVSGETIEDRLRVSYILATDPATTRYGYIEDMHLTAEVRGEEGNTVLIKVAIDKDELRPEHIRPGAGVTAKVECGRRAIGYVWFHDLLAWFRKMWFRWF